MAASMKPRDEDSGENRVRCLYCGANNFPSSPTCWQCGRPLKALQSGAPAAEPGVGRSASAPPPQSLGRPAAVDSVSPALALKAAAALGLMFPFIGLPVGIVFLMLDDARKSQIGWITIGWSIAGSVINAIFLLATLGPVLAFLKAFIPHPSHGGLPGLPGGLSSPGGDLGGLNFIVPYLWQRFQK